MYVLAVVSNILYTKYSAVKWSLHECCSLLAVYKYTVVVVVAMIKLFLNANCTYDFEDFSLLFFNDIP